jgi:predicted DCC family thiol-disulfide oxidoreductase YuxK
MKVKPGEHSKSIVLFDGVCNFCNRSVRFVIRRDREGRFQFAPLQSDLGRRMLQENHLPVDAMSTIVLVENSKVSTRSTAALRIARGLRFPWWMAYYLFIWVPPVLRDLPYRLIARWRYRIFGRQESCPLPPPGIAERFLA